MQSAVMCIVSMFEEPQNNGSLCFLFPVLYNHTVDVYSRQIEPFAGINTVDGLESQLRFPAI